MVIKKLSIYFLHDCYTGDSTIVAVCTYHKQSIIGRDEKNIVVCATISTSICSGAEHEAMMRMNITGEIFFKLFICILDNMITPQIYEI